MHALFVQFFFFTHFVFIPHFYTLLVVVLQPCFFLGVALGCSQKFPMVCMTIFFSPFYSNFVIVK